MKPILFNVGPSKNEIEKRILDSVEKIPEYNTTYFECKNVEKDILVPVVKYKIFDGFDNLITGFSTRLGGVSKEHLFSMNLSFSRGDDKDNVLTNHKRFSIACGYNYKDTVFSDQVHEDVIRVITSDDKGKGITKNSDIISVDGLVTNEKNIPLMTFFADCVPLYAYDPVKHAIGLAHSGWRGTVKKIGSKLIEKMAMEYGSKPEDIICAIGPSICVSCYEVSEDVAIEFNKKFNEEEIKRIMYKKADGKYQLNLHEACRYNFIHAGVQNINIAMPDLCTCCNKDILFSHRASLGKRGNLAAVAMLK